MTMSDVLYLHSVVIVDGIINHDVKNRLEVSRIILCNPLVCTHLV